MMSFSSGSARLLKACLCHRLSQSQSNVSCSARTEILRSHLRKCAVPVVVLSQRNYSTLKCDNLHNNTLSLCKVKVCQHAKTSSSPSVPKVSHHSTLSSSLKDQDKLKCRPELSERRFYSVRWASSQSALALPPAESLEKMRDRYKCLGRKKIRFVLDPDLAELMVDKVFPDGSLEKEKALIIETSPGPGILTRQLLNSGARRLLAMEREKAFLPTLGKVASHSDGRLRAMHADFFSMHYHGTSVIKPPIVRTPQVFEGIEPVPWEADIPIKVIGSIPYKKERTHAYIITSQLLERLASFKYGRVEFNIFMSEACYDVMSQPAGNMFKYRALSALMQLSCDIQLLHKEPLTSFNPYFSGEQNNSISNTKDQTLCLVRITPKRDLFINHHLSQQQAFIFVYFVRQLLVKRKQHLAKIIESWAPGHADIIHQFGYTDKTRTGDVQPADLLRIYTSICQLESFNGSWMGEDVIEYASRALELDEEDIIENIMSQGIQN
ncbi:dimethyladenosine transferase 2, mitochondrial-like [Asterias amurensis]|uniref:dimethyladenosine transferase 2, mitochondrial-like n=1 Tax=Asterias amurensis TaxID=7602 RepID=UPI003AB85372